MFELDFGADSHAEMLTGTQRLIEDTHNAQLTGIEQRAEERRDWWKNRLGAILCSFGASVEFQDKFGAIIRVLCNIEIVCRGMHV